MNQSFRTSFFLALKNAGQIFKKRGFEILQFVFPAAIFIGYYFYYMKWFMVIGLATSLIGLEFFLTGFSTIKSRRFRKKFIFYLLVFICFAAIMRYTLWPFISRYVWASAYHFLALFGQILFNNDYVLIAFLSLLYCLMLCDFLAKWSFLILNKKSRGVSLGTYLLGLHIIFLIFAILVFFTNAMTFSELHLLSWFVLVIVGYLWLALYELQWQCGFTLKQLFDEV